jgi:membrane-associated phospholipid phosphatase
MEALNKSKSVIAACAGMRTYSALPHISSGTMSASPSFPTPGSAFVWGVLPVAACAALAAAAAAAGIDETWFRAGNSFAATLLPVFLWAAITDFGSAPGAFALAAPLLARRPRWIAAMLLAAIPAACLSHALKKLAAQARPAAILPLDEIHIIGATLRSNSFPSGHTITAFVFAGVVVLCVRRPAAWLVLPFAAMVAFSRIAVGAHWPTDLFAGAACGWLMAALGVWWSGRWRFWERARGQRVTAVILLLITTTLFFIDLGYPEGQWMQYLLGFLGTCGALYALCNPAAARIAR